MLDIRREQIKSAPYNPRIIGELARKKLKKAIKENGMVMPIVWNKTTGHCVGGHQRLSVLDELHGGVDYTLTVSCIEVSLKKEKELNVFLNNQNAMGEWDQAGLAEIMKEFGKDEVGLLGFDLVDAKVLLDGTDEPSFVTEDMSLLTEAREARKDVEKQTEELEKIKESRKEQREENKARNEIHDDMEMYITLVFGTRKETEEFQRTFGMDTTLRYHDGPEFFSNLKERMK